MPDLTMCVNDGCPMRTKCYRFMAVANPNRQSYMKFWFREDGTCDDFVEIRGREVRAELKKNDPIASPNQ